MVLVLIIIIGIIILIVLTKLITKYVPVKFSPIISIVLLGLSVYFGWQLYSSIIGPVEFNKTKEERYRKVISNLQDIKRAQEAHQVINGDFAGKWEDLTSFVETAEYALTTRRDSSYADVEKNAAYGIDSGYFINTIVTDTLGFRSVRDSLFQGTDRFKTMMNVPGTEEQFELKAGKLEKSGSIYSVFEARISKEAVLGDLNKDLLAQEMQTNSVEGVRGPYIKVGSMDEVDTSGNWSKAYEKSKN